MDGLELSPPGAAGSAVPLAALWSVLERLGRRGLAKGPLSATGSETKEEIEERTGPGWRAREKSPCKARVT